MWNRFISTNIGIKRITAGLLLTGFVLSCVMPPQGFAQTLNAMGLMSQPKTALTLSPAFSPAYLKAMVIDPKDPFKFEFVIHRGDEALSGEEKQAEYTKLIKYFLAALAVPEDDQWVNLSPYEQDRILPDNFGLTEMGRDLLAQDYILKQISASLINPDTDLGKKFWDRVYAQAHEKFGTTDIPTDTFHKVWIMPDKAVVYEQGNTVYVLENHLKVMLDADYAAQTSEVRKTARNEENIFQTSEVERPGSWPRNPMTYQGGQQPPEGQGISQTVLREIILPILEKEVNEGRNFAPLRQVYSGVLLATWYKRSLKESILGKLYADKSKVQGIDQDPKTNQDIYAQYVKSFQQGAFNMIKEDVDRFSQEIVPRKYFSGGAVTRMPDFSKGTLEQAEKDFAANEGEEEKVGVVLRNIRASQTADDLPRSENSGSTAEQALAGAHAAGVSKAFELELARLEKTHGADFVKPFRTWQQSDKSEETGQGNVVDFETRYSQKHMFDFARKELDAMGWSVEHAYGRVYNVNVPFKEDHDNPDFMKKEVAWRLGKISAVVNKRIKVESINRDERKRSRRIVVVSVFDDAQVDGLKNADIKKLVSFGGRHSKFTNRARLAVGLYSRDIAERESLLEELYLEFERLDLEAMQKELNSRLHQGERVRKKLAMLEKRIAAPASARVLSVISGKDRKPILLGAIKIIQAQIADLDAELLTPALREMKNIRIEQLNDAGDTHIQGVLTLNGREVDVSITDGADNRMTMELRKGAVTLYREFPSRLHELLGADQAERPEAVLAQKFVASLLSTDEQSEHRGRVMLTAQELKELNRFVWLKRAIDAFLKQQGIPQDVTPAEIAEHLDIDLVDPINSFMEISCHPSWKRQLFFDEHMIYGNLSMKEALPVVRGMLKSMIDAHPDYVISDAGANINVPEDRQKVLNSAREWLGGELSYLGAPSSIPESDEIHSQNIRNSEDLIEQALASIRWALLPINDQQVPSGIKVRAKVLFDAAENVVSLDWARKRDWHNRLRVRLLPKDWEVSAPDEQLPTYHVVKIPRQSFADIDKEQPLGAYQEAIEIRAERLVNVYLGKVGKKIGSIVLENALRHEQRQFVFGTTVIDAAEHIHVADHVRRTLKNLLSSDGLVLKDYILIGNDCQESLELFRLEEKKELTAKQYQWNLLGVTAEDLDQIQQKVRALAFNASRFREALPSDLNMPMKQEVAEQVLAVLDARMIEAAGSAVTIVPQDNIYMEAMVIDESHGVSVKVSADKNHMTVLREAKGRSLQYAVTVSSDGGRALQQALWKTQGFGKNFDAAEKSKTVVLKDGKTKVELGLVQAVEAFLSQFSAGGLSIFADVVFISESTSDGKPFLSMAHEDIALSATLERAGMEELIRLAENKFPASAESLMKIIQQSIETQGRKEPVLVSPLLAGQETPADRLNYFFEAREAVRALFESGAVDLAFIKVAWLIDRLKEARELIGKMRRQGVLTDDLKSAWSLVNKEVFSLLLVEARSFPGEAMAIRLFLMNRENDSFQEELKALSLPEELLSTLGRADSAQRGQVLDLLKYRITPRAVVGRLNALVKRHYWKGADHQFNNVYAISLYNTQFDISDREASKEAIRQIVLKALKSLGQPKVEVINVLTMNNEAGHQVNLRIDFAQNSLEASRLKEQTERLVGVIKERVGRPSGEDVVVFNPAEDDDWLIGYALDAGRILRLDLSDLREAYEQYEDEYGESGYDYGRGSHKIGALLFGQVSMYFQQYNYVMSQGDVSTAVYEMLKNAFVHGNKSRFDLPIFIHVGSAEDNKVAIRIVDMKAPGREKESPLAGAGMGIAVIRSSGQLSFQHLFYPSLPEAFDKYHVQHNKSAIGYEQKLVVRDKAEIEDNGRKIEVSLLMQAVRQITGLRVERVNDGWSMHGSTVVNDVKGLMQIDVKESGVIRIRFKGSDQNIDQEFLQKQEPLLEQAIIDASARRLPAPVDRAQKGGIDMTTQSLDMEIKRDGNGIPLPVGQQNLDGIVINGLVPVILDIQPATRTFLFGQAKENPPFEAAA